MNIIRTSERWPHVPRFTMKAASLVIFHQQKQSSISTGLNGRFNHVCYHGYRRIMMMLDLWIGYLSLVVSPLLQ